MKPLLACNYDESKLKFPLIAQPKYDGVRGLTIDGELRGRSLKRHNSEYTNRIFNQPEYNWLDGELCTVDPTRVDCCRITSGDLNRLSGAPDVIWYVFDDTRPEMRQLPYLQRLTALRLRVNHLPHVIVVESKLINSLEELLEYDDYNLERGYEGTILRKPDGTYKEGRSTVRSAELLRIKRFVEEEAVVLELEEGEFNTNEATTNPLGRTERSSAKSGMVPNNQLGTMVCRDVKTGETIRVAAGKMIWSDRQFYWQNKDQLLGKTIKYKYFPKGIKDKPRFPTFQSVRIDSDIDTSAV